MEDALIERGWWVQGITACRGVMVATPRYVGFVPTERPKSLAVEMVWGVAGFVEVNARKVPPERVIAELSSGSLDAQVERLTAGLGGRLWRPAGVTIRAKKVLLRRKHHGLWFMHGKESIRLGRAIRFDDLERRRGQWAGWTWE